MGKVNTRKIAPIGYFSHSAIKKNIPPMSTSGLRKEVIPDKTEDPFENESDDIGVNMDKNTEVVVGNDDPLGFTPYINTDYNEYNNNQNPQKGGRRRRKTRRGKSKKSKKRRRMSRRR